MTDETTPAHAVDPGPPVPADGYLESNGDVLCRDHDLLYTDCYTCNPR